MNELFKNFKIKFPDKKILRLLVIAVICIVFLLMGEFSKSEPVTKNDSLALSQYSREYVQNTQKELKSIIEGIAGAGDVQVMITLENYYENVYAKAYEGQSNNTENDSQESSKETYVTIKNGSNTEECLIVKVYEPQIKGVAVVCSGGDNLNVKKAVTETVCALFGISSAKVSVSKMSD